jgi:hypothetical protein
MCKLPIDGQSEVRLAMPAAASSEWLLASTLA